MTRDELEYSISQYLDGNLPPLAQRTVEEELATSAEARALYEEYRRLNAALKSSLPVPRIDWDRFSNLVSENLGAEEMPVRHFRIGALGWAGRLAMAASVLLVVGITARFAWRSQQAPSVPAPAGPSLAIVSGPQAEKSSGPVVAEVSIGPAPTVVAGWRASEDLITRPTVVLIDRAGPSAQDIDPMPY